ncbi:MAG: hypothetical protein JWO03_1943 [Bacteroidetes bacterium]|nr:hypothetical protein [Bacteroidota bacterium]
MPFLIVSLNMLTFKNIGYEHFAYESVLIYIKVYKHNYKNPNEESPDHISFAMG